MTPSSETVPAVRRDVSMLVTDITEFTPFADVTEPEYVFDTLTEYHRLVGEIVGSHGGEIFDLAGDGAFVLFDGLAETSDAPQRAVRTAIALHRHGRDLITKWQRRGQRLGLKMALNAGFVSLGDVRAGSFSRHAAVGSAVNATFHLSRAARDGEILATRRIADAAAELAEVIARPDIKLSAVTRKLDVFELRPL